MSEVTKNNFKEKLPDIRRSLEKSKFISLDLEFSALHPLQNQAPRERYAKLRMNLLKVIPLQVGITAFRFDNDTNDYFGEFAYLGIPYLSTEDEVELRQQLKSNNLVGENCHLRSEFDDVVKIYFPVVNKWYNSCKSGDFLEIEDIIKKYKHFYEIVFFIHKHLRKSYSQYKQLTHQLFPVIFDTKTVYYELRTTIPKEKLPEETSLEALFHYFKDGLGRHLMLDSSAIECNVEQKNFDSYHEAGWDSFCAGYIFIRMAYYNISLSQHYAKSKKFVASEVISGLSHYKNCVNVIRGATAHI
ncbi:poly(A)-specific ribonuclease PARN-like domain-containing protein 1, partial [Asbolus verrucosus]